MRNAKCLSSVAIRSRIAIGGPDTLLTRGEAAKVVAEAMQVSVGSLKALRNTIAMKMERSARASGDTGLGGIGRRLTGKYEASEVARWSLFHFKDAFGLPLGEKTFKNTVSERVAFNGDGIKHRFEPGSMTSALVEIRRLNEELARFAAQTEARRRGRMRKLRDNLKGSK